MCPPAEMVRTISTSAAGSPNQIGARLSASNLILIPSVTCGLLLSRGGNDNYSRSGFFVFAFYLFLFLKEFVGFVHLGEVVSFPFSVCSICRTRWRSPPFIYRWLVRLSPLLRYNLLITPPASCSSSCFAMGNSFLVRGIRQTSPTTGSVGACRHQLLSPN